MLSVRNLSQTFGQEVVLQDISLEMPKGEVHGVLGPSGCGKTTFLRILCGLLDPTGGTVEIAGQRVTDYSDFELSLKIGYVIQDGGLFPHLTARENIFLPTRIHDQADNELQDWFWQLQEMVRLPPGALDKFPPQLSGGQKQRVAIMRGLILAPPILLLDEPMSSLDPLVRRDLQKDLRDVFEKLDKTVVIVTHHLQEAFFLSHRLTLLNKGKVAQQDQAQKLVDHPQDHFVEEFINAQKI